MYVCTLLYTCSYSTMAMSWIVFGGGGAISIGATIYVHIYIYHCVSIIGSSMSLVPAQRGFTD